MPTLPPPEPWYAAGLAFACQGCGDCCRGPGGYVWIDMSEIDPLAEALGMSRDNFTRKLLRNTPAGLALVDGPGGDCPLLEENGGCRVYASRPMQCRTWPWWRENLASPNAWANAGRRCPGIGAGEPHSRFFIEIEAAKDF